MLGFQTTATSIYQDEYTDITYYTKDINFPIQMTGPWKTVLRTFHDDDTTFILSLWVDRTWYFIDRAYFIIDGKNYSFKAYDTKRRVDETRGVRESAYFNTSLEFIKELAYSSEAKVEFRGSGGSKEFIINSSYREGLIEYLTFIENNPL